MKKILTIFLLIAFSLGAGYATAAIAEKVPAASRTQIKKGKKKKLTRQQGRKLQKKAEKEAKQHQVEMRRREYQQMQEAQQRAAMQMQQQRQAKPH